MLDRVDFVTLEVESTGAAGPLFLKLLRNLAGLISERAYGAGVFSRLLRELSAAVQLGNAAGVLELHGGSEQPAPIHLNLATRLSLPSLKGYGLGSDQCAHWFLRTPNSLLYLLTIILRLFLVARFHWFYLNDLLKQQNIINF